MTVDRLSNGRLVLPVGLGALDDGGFGNVGEPTDARTRAELLDESLAILEGLWTGEPFAFDGRHYRFGPMTFRPTPVQRPRVPIWVVAVPTSERSMARALRHDGIVSQVAEPAELAAISRLVADRLDPADRPFDIVAQGSTPADPDLAAAIVRPWAESGATWWLDGDWGAPTVESVRRRIAAGPPPVRSAGGSISEGSTAG
jgi:hypothetical protein